LKIAASIYKLQHLKLGHYSTVRQFIVDEDKETKEKKVRVEDLSYETLEESLIRPAAPASRLKCLVTSTEDLADQLEPLLLPLIKAALTRQGS
jgi:hypothetical protein